MHRIKLLGGAAIETADGPLTGRAVQRRRLALLALLAAARSRGMSRDKLIAYLWPEADAENGRRFLSDSVYRINQALAMDAIVAAGDELRLDQQVLPSDVGALEDALSRGDGEGAVRLYAGPFLDGFFLSDSPEFERWAEAERDRLAREHAGALEALAEAAERDGERAAAVLWWRRLAAHDPYNSRVAVRLMRALDAAGERAAAIRHARAHETLLRDELEMQPDPAVTEMAERLKQGRAGEHARAAVAPAADPAPPAAVAPASVPAPSPPPSSPRAPAGRRAPAALLWGALAAVVLAALGAWAGARASGRAAAVAATAAAPAHTVAVLPFANVGGERENEYFSDEITEELIITLGATEGLEVASRTSSFAYRNRPADVRDVGRRLGVAAVLEGSVRKAGRRLRITAQLVSTENGHRLWSDAYDRELDGVFAIQEEIARAVAGTLLGAPRGSAPVRLAERATQDPEAYDHYLKGRFAWHQRTGEGLRVAVDHFNQAVARAPDYARAYVGLADAYAVSAFYDYLAPRDAYPKAEAAARRAIEIDSTLAAPHATLGYVLTYYHLDWRGAEEEFRRAIALDPGYSTAHQWYANLLTAAGRFGEAEREMRLAQEADPLSVIAHAALGWSFYLAGRYEAAVEQCRSALALNPDFALARLWGGAALAAMGRNREAREWIGRAVALTDGSVLTRLALAHALAGSGSPAAVDSARAILREVESRAAGGAYVPSYEIAKVHLALGERGRALDWLERADGERSHSRAFLRVDPQLAPLRGDARFERVVERAMPGGRTRAVSGR